MELTPTPLPGKRMASGRLSYKFQRLREKIRQAILTGELSGKLPGERALARRFHANAKTLSKALTDLAAEGLLERSIGRGTYVKGSTPTPANAGKWLLLCDPSEADSPLVAELRARVPDVELVTDSHQLRPSYLGQFTTVIDLAAGTPEPLLRDMVVRNMNVLVAGHEPEAYSVPAVLVDRAAGTLALGRNLLLRGHRRLATVERRGRDLLRTALRSVADRLAPEATIEPSGPDQALAAVGRGVTAVVCDSPDLARQARQRLESAGVDVPGRVSLVAIGCAGENPPCSGWYVTPAEKAEQILVAVRDLQGRRPTTLWLAGRCVDAGTFDQAPPAEQPSPMRLSAAV